MALHSLKSFMGSVCHSRKLGQAVRLILSHPLEAHQYSVYSKILQFCTDLKSRNFGQLIHSRIFTDGFASHSFLNTRLIMFYSKIGEMENARKLFERMSERSVVTWTALLSGYSQNADYEEALRVFSAMHGEGVKANQFTYGSALSACTRLLCLEQGKQIQGCIQKGRFVDNLFVQSALVDLHAKCGNLEDACSVFQSMETRDLVAWNAMIGGYAAQGLNKKAALVFRSMLREGMLPDSFSFGSILRASSVGNDELRKVKIFHGYIFQFGLGADKYLSGSLIDAYVKCGSVDSAHHVYNNMQNKDVVSCTALIKGYACEGKSCETALHLFNEVQKNLTIDGTLLCSMLNICAKTASLSLGKQLHANAIKYQNQHDTALSNALIDMYSKSGVIQEGRRVFDKMKGKNVISWTSMISGYGKHGYGHEAVELYLKMENEGLKPNDVTFLSLLFACSHNGLTTQGWECFSNMVRKHGLVPRAEHYACLVDIVARSGCLEEAYDLLCRIPTDADGSVLGAILGACSSYGDMNVGDRVSRWLLELEPGNPASYVVLSGIYAAAGLWNSVWETRMLMGKKNTRKYPGYSLCQSTSKTEALLPST